MPLLRKQHSHLEEEAEDSHTHRTPLTMMPTLSGHRRLFSEVEEKHLAGHLPDSSLGQEHFEMEHFPLQGGGSSSASLGGKCADPVLAPSYTPQGAGGGGYGGYGGYVPVGSPLLPPGVPSLAPAPPPTSGSDDPYNNPLLPPRPPPPSPPASSNSTRAHTTVVSAMKVGLVNYKANFWYQGFGICCISR